MPDKRLVWKCRRGSKELDLILGRFLENEYERADPDKRRAFERLLEYSDPDIQDLLYGTVVSDNETLNRLAGELSGRNDEDADRDSH